MRNTFVTILTLIGFIVFGQENNLEQIVSKVNSIESDSTLTVKEFDLPELTGITTDGGGTLKVWWNEKQIYKIVEEIYISIGRLKTIVYLESATPIKIIENEDYYEQNENGLNYKKLVEGFKSETYFLDWNKKTISQNSTGTRGFSDCNNLKYNYEQIIARAENAVKK